jgi:PHP family Zn ribbon phosphoesterase
MLRTIRADLHIHSCLSPCGDEEMRPCAIVRKALAMGLDMIAICDHNSAENLIYQNLLGENVEEVFGCQTMVNEKDETIGINRKMLIGATLLPLEQIVSMVGSLRGVTIASHIDRQAFSLLGQLGFIPEGLSLDGLEISARTSKEEAQKRFYAYRHYSFVRFSDAHYLEDIGKNITHFLLAQTNSEEIKMALHHQGGRRVVEQ